MADLLVFGQRIKQLRKELGLSQRDFAEKIGVTASALSAYEKGAKNPSVNVAIDVASQFNVSLDWLCGLAKYTCRFTPDDSIPFDLSNALYALMELIQAGLLSIPAATEGEDHFYDNLQSLDVKSAGLGEIICNLINFDRLCASGALANVLVDRVKEEYCIRAFAAIRAEKRAEIEHNKELEDGDSSI